MSGARKSKTRVRIDKSSSSDPRRRRGKASRGSEVAKQANQTHERSEEKQDTGQNRQK